MQSLRTEWPATEIAYYRARAGRAMHGHPRQRELIETFLGHLGVHGDVEGRPILDLRGWSKRQNVKRLRELITAYEYQLIAEYEARSRRPNGPGIVGRREPQTDNRAAA